MLCALIAKSADSVVNATEVVVQRVVQSGECVCDAVGLLVDLADKCLLVNGSANIRLRSTRCRSTGAITSAISTKAVTASAEQQKYDNPCPVIAEHAIVTVAVISVIAYDRRYVSSRKLGNSNRQFICLLSKLYLCQSHSGLSRTSFKSTAANNLLRDLRKLVKLRLRHLAAL